MGYFLISNEVLYSMALYSMEKVILDHFWFHTLKMNPGGKSIDGVWKRYVSLGSMIILSMLVWLNRVKVPSDYVTRSHLTVSNKGLK